MATEQVINWIGGMTSVVGQEPVKLSKTIDSFEADFANGYLFGELLTQYGICESLTTFSKKTNKDAKCHNFYQIEEALRFLKVNFDAKIIHQIMNEERGAALRLLYQLKLGLDKHFATDKKGVTNIKTQFVDAKHQKSIDFMNTLSKAPMSILKKEHNIEGPSFKGKNFQIIENKMLRFEVARANLEKKAYDDTNAEKNLLASIQQQKRQDSMRKMKENNQFMKEWEADGKKNWKINQNKRAAEIERMLYFEEREVKIYKDNLNSVLEAHQREQAEGIDQFHENMRKLGIEESISIQDAVKRQEEKKGIPPGQIQNFSYAATMNKIKETKNNNEFAGKERERRNRKMKVDQLKIQETLDAKKLEETRIQKFLQKQAKEQDQAYLNWRNQNCQKIVNDNNKKKASKAEAQRKKQTAELERKMKKEADDAEPERQKQRMLDVKQCKEIRKQQKAKKRHLNIEIASEIVDLIMDVSDEAFDFISNAQNSGLVDEDTLVPKPKWREWMDIFGQGLKVSEQRLLVNQDPNDIQRNATEKDISSTNAISQILSPTAQTTSSPYKLISEIRNEPIYDDFLQYVSMCGPLNMRLVAADRWHMLRDLIQKEQMQVGAGNKDLELEFLNQLYVPSNQELGRFVSNLYARKELLSSNPQLAMPAIEEQKQEDEHKTSFPSYHNLKLCVLGKAYSGKKTQAQLLVDKIGSQNVTLFDMGEMIREALVYIDPAQQKEDAVDNKAKKPAKGGAAADAPVDKFAGQDTTKYKEIAQVLLQQIQLVTGNDKEIPGKDVDIVSLISDDSALVSLFVQKLSLTFKGEGPSQEDREQKLRTKYAQELELIDQLEEAKGNEGQDADPKAKGKGKASKSPQEIQDEIDQLYKTDVEGWILLDFPRNLNQAKMLENLFTGYESITDVPKSQDRQNFETMSKLTDPHSNTIDGYNGDILAQPSLFDAMFLLDADQEECHRRGKNRKQDPTNGTIYHAEDQPPPENDTKLVERLTDYFGCFSNEEDMIQKIDLNHAQFSEGESSLRSFYEGFGRYDRPTNRGVNSFFPIQIQNKQKKDDTSKGINNLLDQVLKFKQIYTEREYQQVKEKVKAEEKAKLEQEAKEAAGAQDSSRLEKVDSQKQVSEKKSTLEHKQSENGEPSKAVPKDIPYDVASKGSLHSNRFSQSKLSFKGSQRQKQREYTRELKIKIWEDMECTYLRQGLLTMNEIRLQRESAINNLNVCQRGFIQFLERPSNSQEKVNEFVNSFNKFSFEFPDLRKDDQTKEELLSRVEQLSNSLWESIEQRKDESIEHIKMMSNKGGWADQEMRQTLKNMAGLIELEIKKFEAVYMIVMESEPSVELDAEIMTRKLLDRGIPCYDGDKQTSPAFEQVISNLIQKLDELVNNNPIVQQVINDAQGQLLLNEKKIFIYRLAMVFSWCLCILHEIYTNSSNVMQLLDDWIVHAVAQENQISSTILKILRNAIHTEQISLDEYQTQLQSLSLFSKIETSQFKSDETPLYLRDVHVPTDELDSNRFTVQNLRELYCEMRYNSGDKGSVDTLDQQSFINIMLLAIRQGRIPLAWKYNPFNKLNNVSRRFSIQPLQGPGQSQEESPQKFQSDFDRSLSKAKGYSMTTPTARQWVDWKQVMTLFTLLNSPIPSEASLGELRVKLTDLGQNQYISCSEFVQCSFWFDDFEGKPSPVLEAMWLAEKQAKRLQNGEDSESEEEDEQAKQRLDEERLEQIKVLLFDIHRVSTGEDKLYIPSFIDALIHAANSSSQVKDSEFFQDSLFAQ